MDILHITRDLAPQTTGGISTAVHTLARAQAAQGHRVGVVSFDRWRPRANAKAGPMPEPHDEGGLAVLRLSSPTQLSAAGAFAHGFGASVVHAHHGMLWPFAEGVAREAGAGTAISVHVLQARQDELRGLAEPTMSARAQVRALRDADAIVAPSRAVALALRVMDPPWSAKMHIVPLAVEDSEAAQAATAGRKADGPLGPLLYAGRFADMHGTAELLTALPLILGEAQDATAVIAGGLPDSPKAQARWMQRWRDGASADIRERVRFTGWLGPDALSACYAEAGIVLAPSLYETFGQSPREAHLHGAAVIASRVGGLGDAVKEGETGLLIPPGDVDSLVEATLSLLADPKRAWAMGQAGARQVRSGPGPAAVAEAMGVVYAQITGAGPA